MERASEQTLKKLSKDKASFEEFVIADGGGKYIDGIGKFALDRGLSALYTVPMEKYLKNYYIVGGMPEAVQTWIDTHDYRQVEEIQEQVLKGYAEDFGKHTSAETATKIRLIWEAIPSQIARDNNKFVRRNSPYWEWRITPILRYIWPMSDYSVKNRTSILKPFLKEIPIIYISKVH